MSDQNLEKANRNVAISAAESALRDAGAKSPGTLAQVLVERGHIRADLTEGPDHVEVRTSGAHSGVL